MKDTSSSLTALRMHGVNTSLFRDEAPLNAASAVQLASCFKAIPLLRTLILQDVVIWSLCQVPERGTAFRWAAAPYTSHQVGLGKQPTDRCWSFVLGAGAAIFAGTDIIVAQRLAVPWRRRDDGVPRTGWPATRRRRPPSQRSRFKLRAHGRRGRCCSCFRPRLCHEAGPSLPRQQFCLLRCRRVHFCRSPAHPVLRLEALEISAVSAAMSPSSFRPRCIAFHSSPASARSPAISPRSARRPSPASFRLSRLGGSSSST